MTAPPLWKALVRYSAALSAFFALLGLIGADGHPGGAMTGIGILVLIHFAPFLGTPTIDPDLTLVVMAVLGVAAWGLLRVLPQWWRVAFVIALAMAGLLSASRSWRNRPEID
jgi:hypothetical protein